MSEMGYNVILIRDCTTAIEAHDIVDQQLITKILIETKYAWSTTSKEFIRSCVENAGICESKKGVNDTSK